MKTLRITIAMTLLSVCSLALSAQETVAANTGFFIELGFSIDQHNNYYNEDKYTSPVITPMIGYRFHSRWTAGAGVGFETGHNRLHKPKYSVFATYDIVRSDRWSVFVQGQAAYSHKKEEVILLGDPNATHGPIYEKHDWWEGGVRFGASYDFNDHFSALVRYLYIGYSSRTPYSKKIDGVLGKHDFIMDAGVRPLQLSLRYTF